MTYWISKYKEKMYTAIKGGGIMIFTHTAQKKKFFVEDFFSKCDAYAVSCGYGHICWRNP